MKYQNLCMCDSCELWAASFIDDDEIIFFVSIDSRRHKKNGKQNKKWTFQAKDHTFHSIQVVFFQFSFWEKSISLRISRRSNKTKAIYLHFSLVDFWRRKMRTRVQNGINRSPKSIFAYKTKLQYIWNPIHVHSIKHWMKNDVNG